jgi:hypothetical protein
MLTRMGFTLGNRFIASCPEGAPEYRSVMSHDFLPPLQGGALGYLTQAEAHARQHKAASFWKKLRRRLES